uniref:Zn(2)-C6 fungal-type domain-containing protein n=1 Tax=Kwoniella bestiolae CBS 10118 TaxID=1296100 RepID=A0A1B9GEP6_9TREE|nr:hypothetical protein I302_00960 [Kwoniella bestiolae CBS 10118]OCF29455.1 hypothetical protein I302_00960 [Kwoniella bestiolae CBS 10118]
MTRVLARLLKRESLYVDLRPNPSVSDVQRITIHVVHLMENALRLQRDYLQKSERESTQKRKRVYYACDACYTAPGNDKCEKDPRYGPPIERHKCTQCIKNRLACTYDLPRKKRGYHAKDEHGESVRRNLQKAPEPKRSSRQAATAVNDPSFGTTLTPQQMNSAFEETASYGADTSQVPEYSYPEQNNSHDANAYAEAYQESKTNYQN